MCVTPRDSSNGRYTERMLSHCCGNVASMLCSEDVASTPRDSSDSATSRGCCPTVVAMLCQCCVVRMLYQCFVIVATSLFVLGTPEKFWSALTRLPKECFISMGFEEQRFFSLLEQMRGNLLIEVVLTRFSLHLQCWRILKDSYFIRYIYTRWIYRVDMSWSMCPFFNSLSHLEF